MSFILAYLHSWQGNSNLSAVTFVSFWRTEKALNNEISNAASIFNKAGREKERERERERTGKLQIY